MSNAIKIGAEILVNTITDSFQASPSITRLPGGGFVTAWFDESHSDDDPNKGAIRAQRFDMDGNRLGGEFRVNTTTSDDQNQPSITTLSDGRFIIAWIDGSQRDGTRGYMVRAQVYEADGDPSGPELVVTSATEGQQEVPAVAALSGGRFIAVWQHAVGTSFEIHGRIWNADGSPSGNDFRVNTTTSNLQDFPTITALTDGRFVAAWDDKSNGGDVRARIFNADGTPAGSDFLVNTILTAGVQGRPSITALADGRFVVAWDSAGGDSNGYGVRARIFHADGATASAELVVNTETTFSQWQPKIAALPDGGFVAAWTSNHVDGSNWVLRAQVFDADGKTLGDELAVTTTPDSWLTDYAIATIAGGRFVITWQAMSETGGDTDQTSIRAQVFGFANGAPVITSDGGGDGVVLGVSENTTAVTTVTATDPDGSTVSYSIAGGVDSSKFQIDATTGALSFKSAPDFEMPGDDGGNNNYHVIIAASDGTLSDLQTITVNVTDLEDNGAPSITSNGGGNSATVSLSENATMVTTVTAADPDNDAIDYSIVGGADAALFQIDEATGALSFIDPPDYETPRDTGQSNTYFVFVRASDGSEYDEQAITVNVTDLAAPTEFGNEILVNTTTAGYQVEPTITGLANGRFVVTWTDDSGSDDDPNGAVRGQVFNADGSKAGGEFRVNTTTLDFQFEPTTTALADGRFIVAWSDFSESGGDTSGCAVRAQVFHADGTRSGAEFLIPASTANDQYEPTITGLADGRFVVAWADASVDDSTEVRARIFNADGSPSGGEFLVNSNMSSYQAEPTITALPDGSFVVAWSDWSATGGDQSAPSVRGQVFHADGARIGSELLINTTTANSQYDSSITALADGRFVVAWSDYSQSGGDTSEYAVRARIFKADGSESVAEFLVNTETYSFQWLPQLTALSDGRFVASWADASSGSFAIRAQVFDAAGTRSGDEFVVAAPGSEAEGHTIATLADGRFVVAWAGQYATGNDTSNTSIHAQIFDPREGAVNLVGTPLDDDLVGTAFSDTITGLAGNDRLDGGDGEDTAVFSQSADKYTFIDLGDWAVISGPDGTDVLFNFEHFEFAAGGPAPTPGTISGLFDTPYYLALNTDVFDAKVSAIDHFNTFGWHEGRNPNAWFDTTGYVAANPSVVALGLNPLDHYHQIGWREGRDPGANFDTTLYLLHNPDVAAAGVDPLEHYMQHGRAEGRAIYQAVGRSIEGGFDAEWYLFHNPDVAAAGVDPLLHYNAIGWQEGRDPNAWFDSAGYLAHYTDVAAAGINPLQHYEAIGWKEGRDASTSFDTAGYLAANPDVAAAGMNPLDHFLQHGIYEGRQAVNDGVWS
jgi:hypothetical protein